MTHVSLHRCRFVDYPPSSITSVAFSHPSSPQSRYAPPKTLRLAIGRNNGSIEIWNPLNGTWYHEVTLQGGKDRSIESLAWIQDYDAAGNGHLRLLSIGYSSILTEWDLSTGRPAKHVDCHGGAIWSLAAQPRRNIADVPQEERDSEDDDVLSQKIVVGTDDGTLKLISTAGGPGQLAFVKNLTRAGSSKSRVLSLAWKDRYTVVAGMADSTIRVWDIRSGRSIARMSLNRERGKEVLVWAIKVLKNGDVVSGDSRGEVCFWNGANWTLKQRMKAHGADCLTLEVGGQNGDRVISGGADMRTVLYKLTSKERGWGEIARKRFHRHDVRAMAVYESGAFSVVVSGGVDMTPIIIPFRGFTTENHRTLPLVPQSPIVTTIPGSRILMSYWENEVKIWKIEELREIMPTNLNIGGEDQGRKILCRIILGNEEYITSAAISSLPHNAGYVLAIATIGEVKLFCLRMPKRTGSDVLRVQKIVLPESLPLKKSESKDFSDSEAEDYEDEEISLSEVGARQVRFSPDGRWLLIITPSSEILIADLSITAPTNHKEKPAISITSVHSLCRSSPSQTKATRSVPRKKKQDEGTLSTYVRTITKTSFSTTSRLLSVGELSGEITTYSLSRSTSWEQNPTSIPVLTAAPTVLSYRPHTPKDNDDDGGDDDDDELVLLPADTQTIHLFSTTTGLLTPWSRANSMPSHLPIEFAAAADRAVDAFWEHGDRDRLWCWSANWVWMFDFSRDWPALGVSFNVSAEARGKKRKKTMGTAVGSVSGARGKMTFPMGLIEQSEAEEAIGEGEERGEVAAEWSDNGDIDGDVGGEGRKGSTRKRKGQKPYWGSWRYRSLLGLLPVGGKEVVEMFGTGWGKGGREEGLKAVEMVVVERPIWDVGLPPRFYDGRS